LTPALFSATQQVASRRFAELAACVHTLKAKIFEAQGQQHSDLEIQLEFIPHTLISCLSDLSMRFVELLKRLAGQHSKLRSKTVFLINNLDQVGSPAALHPELWKGRRISHSACFV